MYGAGGAGFLWLLRVIHVLPISPEIHHGDDAQLIVLPSEASFLRCWLFQDFGHLDIGIAGSPPFLVGFSSFLFLRGAHTEG